MNNTPLTMLDCRYGTMLSFTNDDVIGRSLRLYGEWAEHELAYLRGYIRAGSTVVDVGANIGTHSLPFSRWVGTGKVVAIEAQPLVSNVLNINCHLNDIANVNVYNVICGKRHGYAQNQVNYSQERNVGAVSFNESLHYFSRWQRIRSQKNFSSPNVISVVTIDELTKNDDVSLVKLDIEGMELDALRGAKRMLQRSSPVVYFEQLNCTQLAELHSLFSNLGYSLFWLETHPFNANNFRGTQENIWWRTEMGILAIPPNGTPPPHLQNAHASDSALPYSLDARQGIFVN